MDKKSTWGKLLKSEFEKDYFIQLKTFVEEEYNNKVCYPPKNEILNAFRLTPFEDVKIVIIGQDPYHGPNQAHGLCFSVNEGIPFPPSLINIFKEIASETGKNLPNNGNLTHWAKQGVFLLNATLTVEAHSPGSHQGKGWEIFTDKVIKLLSDKRAHLIFLLWGAYAKRKSKLIDTSKHTILISGHPSPLSANRGYWFGNNHFIKANELLIRFGNEPIIW